MSPLTVSAAPLTVFEIRPPDDPDPLSCDEPPDEWPPEEPVDGFDGVVEGGFDAERPSVVVVVAVEVAERGVAGFVVVSGRTLGVARTTAAGTGAAIA